MSAARARRTLGVAPATRLSKHFALGRSQPTLDFVDVDVRGDVALFIDPRALLLDESDWGHECVSLLQHFFGEVLALIKAGANPSALLGQLREPNETRLGLSKGRAHGHGLGPELAYEVGSALSRSEAARTGLLQDLEDTILMVPGVGPDLISDIATNVIREPLLNYTREMAEEYGLPLVPDVYVGPIWSPSRRQWIQRLESAVMADDRPLVLVPKAIVRLDLDYDADEYLRHFIIPRLQAEEIDAASGLVHLLKDGTPRVDVKDVIEKYGRTKADIERLTLERPELLDAYRKAKEDVHPPLSHDALAFDQGESTPDWDALLNAVVSTPSGNDDASRYHDAVKDLLTALLYPALTSPRKEVRLNDGRKRVDIVFTNIAKSGFFHWLGDHFAAPHIFVECKNYEGDPGNPELDQLGGRFSPRRAASDFSFAAGSKTRRGSSPHVETRQTRTEGSSSRLTTTTSGSWWMQGRPETERPSSRTSSRDSRNWCSSSTEGQRWGSKEANQFSIRRTTQRSARVASKNPSMCRSQSSTPRATATTMIPTTSAKGRFDDTR